MKTRPVIILAVVVLLIVGGAIWFLQQSAIIDVTDQTSSTPVPAATPAPVASAPSATPVPSMPALTDPNNPPMTQLPATEREPWEERIDQVLNMQNIPLADAAQLLINMMPTLPAQGQTDAAQHISNLLENKDYSRMLPLLKNTSYPREVQEVLFTDVMNREDAVKLPALLEIAKISGHPFQQEATENLQLFLNNDYKQNWAQWAAAVQDYVRKQTQEMAIPAPAGAPETVPLDPGAPPSLPPAP